MRQHPLVRQRLGHPTERHRPKRQLIGASTFAIALLMAPTLSSAASKEVVDEFMSNMTSEDVSDLLVQTVREALPEQRNANAAFLNPAYDPNLTLSKDAQVSVTFLDEGAGYRNSLGYYAYMDGALDGLTKADIDTDGSGVVSLAELQAVDSVETGWIFPNASRQGAGGSLVAGDTVTLGDGKTFAADTTVGFYLTQNGWTGSGVRTEFGGTSPQTMFTTDFLNPEAAATSTLLTDSSTNSSRHTAMMFGDSSKSNVILGFEDLNRVDRRANAYGYRTDEDFNDAVFIVRANPEDAFSDAKIATAPAAIPGNLLSSIIALSVFGFSYRSRRRSSP